MKFILSVLIYVCFNIGAFAMSGLVQSNACKTGSSIENAQMSIQSAAISKIGNQRILKYLKRSNAAEGKKRDKRLLLTILGLLSLTLVSWALGFQLLLIVGLAFFTFATGIGYLISSKKQGEKNNRFPKAMFITAIVLNLLIAAGLFIFSLSFTFD